MTGWYHDDPTNISWPLPCGDPGFVAIGIHFLAKRNWIDPKASGFEIKINPREVRDSPVYLVCLQYFGAQALTGDRFRHLKASLPIIVEQLKILGILCQAEHLSRRQINAQSGNRLLKQYISAAQEIDCFIRPIVFGVVPVGPGRLFTIQIDKHQQSFTCIRVRTVQADAVAVLHWKQFQAGVLKKCRMTF